MASGCAPTGWLTGSPLDTPHKVPLPMVTAHDFRWKQTKNHVIGGGRYIWEIPHGWLAGLRCPDSVFHYQGTVVRATGSEENLGSEGEGGQWGRPWLIWQHQSESTRWAFIALWQSWFIRQRRLLWLIIDIQYFPPATTLLTLLSGSADMQSTISRVHFMLWLKWSLSHVKQTKSIKYLIHRLWVWAVCWVMRRLHVDVDKAMFLSSWGIIN